MILSSVTRLSNGISKFSPQIEFEIEKVSSGTKRALQKKKERLDLQRLRFPRINHARFYR